MPATSVPVEQLRQSMTAVLAFHTVSDGDAVAIADVLLDGELRGYDDHGVLFLANLTEWFRSGAMNPTPTPRVLHQRRAGALVDGDGGCGVIGATVAMETCLSLASDHGMAAVGLQRSGHFVAAAPYALMAARRGFIGFVTSNTPPLMAPTGGLSRSLGTNPLAYAFPNGEQDPLLLDMATSAIAGYKVRLAAKEGRHLDEGLITDAEGKPSTDPNDFVRGGLVLPSGGYKGYGLALVVDVLSGVLTGAGFGQTASVTNGKGGQFFMAIDPELFMPLDQFVERLQEDIRQVKSGRKAAGVEEIFVPGERGQRRRRELLAAGSAPLSAISYQALVDECTRAAVRVPGAH